jgi:hypothetical protein
LDVQNISEINIQIKKFSININQTKATKLNNKTFLDGELTRTQYNSSYSSIILKGIL